MEKLVYALFGPVSTWLRSSARALSSVAGYSVLETVALANRTHVALPSQRTPGINMIACIATKTGQPYDEWLESHPFSEYRFDG